MQIPASFIVLKVRPSYFLFVCEIGPSRCLLFLSYFLLSENMDIHEVPGVKTLIRLDHIHLRTSWGQNLWDDVFLPLHGWPLRIRLLPRYHLSDGILASLLFLSLFLESFNPGILV